MTRALRGVRLGLLVSTCAFATMATPTLSQTVAFQGNLGPHGGTTVVSNGTTDTITVSRASTVLNWTTTGPVTPSGSVDFLPEGRTAAFVGAANLPDYVVLNRVAASDAAPIALNGTVTTRITDAAGAQRPGGAVWFYSPGGIIVGPRAFFDIGSLLLTTSNVGIDDRGEVNRNRFEVFPAAGGGVTITAGARITAGAPGSYVAVIAPRIEQAGTVTVNGSAAYVSGERATVTIDRGLFDIRMDDGDGGSGGRSLVHSGVTTGPAADAGSGEAHRIYMVALPANEAVTMLASGRIGFAASTAAVENGVVVLSAGTGTADQTPLGLDSANGAVLDVHGADFTSRVAGTILGTANVRSGDAGSRVRLAEGGGLVSTGAMVVTAEGVGATIEAGRAMRFATMTGGGPASDILLRASGGGLLSFAGTTVDTNPANGPRGQASAIRLENDGGRFVFGDTQLNAAGRGSDGGQGGAVSLDLRGGGTAEFAGLFIDNSGTGNAARGFDGVGGNVSIATAADTALTVGGGGLFVRSDGIGEAGGLALGGNGRGGRIDVSAGGRLALRQLATFSAEGRGSAGDANGDVTADFAGGAGIGGTVNLTLAADATLRDLQIYTRGRGGAGGGSAGQGGTGGAATGGDVGVLFRGETVTGTLSFDAGAVGGAGGAAIAAGSGARHGSGGEARSGAVSLVTEGNTRFGDGIGLSANAVGGNGNSSAGGSAGAGGAATASTVNFVAGGGTTRVAQSLSLSANATGGGTAPFVAGGLATAGTVTIATRGDTEVWALYGDANASGGVSSANPQTITAGTVDVTAYGTLNVRSALGLSARATVNGGLLNVGTVRGGAVALRAASGGGVFRVREAARLDASANGTVPPDASGQPVGSVDAVGGTVTLATVEAGYAGGGRGGTIATVDTLTLRAEAIGGEGFNGGDARGGGIAFSALAGGTFDIGAALDASAAATSGVNRDGSSQAAGGTFALGGDAGSTIGVAGRTTVSLSGTARNAGGGFSGAGGTGGDATITLAGGVDPAATRLALADVAIAANGTGGGDGSNSASSGSGGGAGTGGTVTIDLRQATGRIGSLDIDAAGSAGIARFGASGTGGRVSLLASGGTLGMAGALDIAAPGSASGRESFGTGQGGAISVDVRGSASVELGAVTLASIGVGSPDARSGQLRIGVTDGSLALTSAALLGTILAPVFTPALGGDLTTAGDIRFVSRGATDRFSVGGGPATVNIAVSDGGTGDYSLLVDGNAVAYTGPNAGRFGVLNRVTGLDPVRRALLGGRIGAEAPAGGSSSGEVAFYNAGGVSLSNGAVFSGRRLVLTTDATLRPDVSAGAFQGSPDVRNGDVGFERTATLDTITIRSRTALIDWTPNDNATSGTIDFLPSGATARFQNDPANRGGFTVLNRILPGASGRTVAFNGTVLGRVTEDGAGYVPGGTLWFYSPGGILAGAGAVFDVGSLLLSTNAVALGGGFDLFQPDGSVRLVADAGSLAQVSVAAGAAISAADLDGSVVLAGARVDQQGSVAVDGLAAYIAASDVRLDAASARATMLAASAAGGRLLTHGGITGGLGRDGATNRILLSAAGGASADGVTIEAGGTLGFGPARGGQITVAAGGDAAGGTLAVGNGVRLTGGEWTSATAVSASGGAAVDIGGSTRFLSDLSLAGGDARVQVRGGGALRVGGDLRLASSGGTAIVAVDTGASAEIAGAVRLDASAATTGGLASLRVDGVLATTDLSLDASGVSRGGLAEVAVSGDLTVLGAAGIRADASGDAAGTAGFLGSGGQARFGTLALSAVGAGTARGGTASVDTTELGLTVAGLTRLDAGAANATAGTARFASGGDASLSTLELASAGRDGSGRAELARRGGAFALDDLRAVAGGTIAIDAGTGLTVGNGVDLSAARVELTAATTGTTITAGRIAARASAAVDATGAQLSANEIALTGGSIAIADVAAGRSLVLRTLAGDLSTGLLGGGSVALDAAGALVIDGIAATGDVGLTASGPMTVRGAVSANGFSAASFGRVTLGAVAAETIGVSGAVVDTGPLRARTGDIVVTSGGGLSLASAAATRAVTLNGGDVRTGALFGDEVTIEGASVAAGVIAAGTASLAARDGAIVFDNLTASRAVRLTGRSVDFASVSAGGDVNVAGLISGSRALSIASNGAISLGAVARDGTVAVTARQALTLGDARATTLTLRAASIEGGALRATGAMTAAAESGDLALATVMADGPVMLDASGALRIASVESGGAVTIAATGGSVIDTVRGTDIRLTGDLLGSGLLAIDARDGIDLLGPVRRAGALVLSGRRITLADATATDIRLRGTEISGGVLTANRGGIDAVASDGTLSLASASAPGGLSLAGARGVRIGSAAAGGALAISGALDGSGDLRLQSGGALTFAGDIARDGMVSLDAGGDLAFAGISGGAVRLRGATVVGGPVISGAGVDIVARSGTVGLGGVSAVDALTLIAAGAVTLGDASASSAVIRGTRVEGATLSAGAVEIAASSGPIGFTRVTAGGPLTLSANGSLLIGRFAANGAATLSGKDIAVEEGSARGGVTLSASGVARLGALTEEAGGIGVTADTAEISRLDATGAITVTTTGALTVQRAAARGGIALASLRGAVTADVLDASSRSGTTVTPAAPPRVGDVTVAAAGDTTIGSVAARGVLRVEAGGVAHFTGLATASGIEVASADIAIAEGARLGAGATTGSVRFLVQPGRRVLIGGTGDGSGFYTLDNAEAGRVRARQIAIVADRAGTASDRPADVTIAALTLRHESAAGDSSLFGDSALFRVETPGTARIVGRVAATGFGRNDRVEVLAGERLDVVAPAGGVSVTGMGGAPSGRLLLASDRIVVATDAAARDVAAAPGARQRGERLGLTDGSGTESGYVSAGGLEFEVGRALYIQNSGGSALETRAGFTSGQDGLSVRGTGASPPEVIINGRGVGGDGAVTQSGAAFQPAIASAAPGSSINGCDQGGGLCAPTVAMLEMTVPAGRATNNSSLQAVQGMEAVSTGSGVSSAMSSMSGTADADEAGDGEGSGGKAVNRPSARVLISARGIAGTSLMPLIDEPVTSVGNDDFWLDTMLDSALAP